MKGATNTGIFSMATLAWVLSTAGFAILLGGLASMQQDCGKSGANGPIPPGMGAVGYLAPVPCDRFFSFDWFIIFFHFFVWFIVAVFLFSRTVHLARPMLTAMLAIAATMLMFQANTWYRINGVGSGLSSTFKARARTLFAGAIVASIADLLLLLLLGIHDEKDIDRSKHEEHVVTGPPGYRPTGAATTATTVPAAATTTTTTTHAHAPAGTAAVV